jgi:hypothetical protein
MATTELKRIQLLSRTTVNLTQQDPILLDGELVIADSGSSAPNLRLGDGVRHWSALPSFAASGAAPPNMAIQFNNGGTFAGDPSLTFDVAGSSMQLGGGASPAFVGTREIQVRNSSTADNGCARIAVASGDNATGASCALWAANGAQSTPIVVGGPIGAQACLRTLGNPPGQPLVFGTANSYRGKISGSGNWVFAVPDSLSPAASDTLTLGTQSGSSAIVINGPAAPASYDPLVIIKQPAIAAGGSYNVGVQFAAYGTGAAVTQPFIVVSNDASGGDFVMQRTSTNYTGTAVAGGPVGPSTSMYTNHAGEAFVLGANGRCFLYGAAAGGVILPAPPAAHVALIAAGVDNQPVAIFNGTATSGKSYGVQINAGTTAADYALNVNNQVGGALMGVYGDGSFFAGPNFAVRITAAGGVTIAKPTSGNALIAAGADSQPVAIFNGSVTSTKSYGVQINAGTTAADFAINVNNQVGGALMGVYGDGSFFAGPNFAVRITAAGGMTIAQPTSGAALAITGAGAYAPLTITDTGGGQLDAITINNSGAANGDNARWAMSAGTVSVACFAAPPANTAAIVTGGPTGGQGVLRVLGAGFPLVFGTNQTYRGQIDGNGAWVIAAPSVATSASLTIFSTATSGNHLTLDTPSGGRFNTIGMLNNGTLRAQVYYDNTTNALTFTTNIAAAQIKFMAGNAVAAGTVSATGTWAFPGAVGINGATPYAGSAGWGTPTGTGVVTNYPGASATLVQTSTVVATLIAILKNFGLMFA